MIEESYDIAIVGGGSAGVAAAVTSARSGAKTILLERSTFPGGIPVYNGLTTLCGLYLYQDRDHPDFVNEGFPKEVAEILIRKDRIDKPVKMGKSYVLPIRPATLESVSRELLSAEPELNVSWTTEFKTLERDDEGVRSIQVEANGKPCRFNVRAVIDCTGTAEVCESAGEPCTGKDQALTPALVIPLHQVDLNFSQPSTAVKILLAITRAVRNGELPEGSESLSFTPNLEPGAVTMKWNLGAIPSIEQPADRRRVESESNEKAGQILHFMQQSVTGFSRCTSPQSFYPLALRRSRTLAGVYVLSGKEVLDAVKCEDAAARGCWPVEEWDSTGRCSCRYLPVGEYYDIPNGSLMARRTNNLFVAGKCISADHEAVASARVVGCCLATGEAAGKLATRKVAM